MPAATAASRSPSAPSPRAKTSPSSSPTPQPKEHSTPSPKAPKSPPISPDTPTASSSPTTAAPNTTTSSSSIAAPTPPTPPVTHTRAPHPTRPSLSGRITRSTRSPSIKANPRSPAQKVTAPTLPPAAADKSSSSTTSTTPASAASRAAIESDGPRTIRSRVAGTSPPDSTILLKHPFLTIDGASAPAPGITLQRHGLEVHTHDVALRHFRIRIGDPDLQQNNPNIIYSAGGGECALYFSEGAHHCIGDHLSLSWSTNKILCTTKLSDLITIQWCILSEALNIDGHGYASITGGNRVTWHHNLFAHNFSRNVRFQGAVDADFRNNVIYDWGEKSAYGEFDRLNYIGNYLKPGPSTTQRPHLFHDGIEFTLPHSLYFADNVIENDPRATTDNWKGTAFYFDRATLAAPAPFPAPPVTTEPAAKAFDDVLQNAGATLPERDATDRRVVAEVRAGTGKIIQSTKEIAP